ncbi:hypothetical protein EU642_21915 [Salmonella enterica]|nr:hypothetical protein [Salmonella enterica]EAO0118511.1 hypothetical protein [Salmonella enterica]EAO3601616.1 hypothetical protein [Salmonella enterica]EAR6391509.1 hypothetical protein [Salmonella enterica]EAV1285273.1 hypothetical protein [Salmonella enterica]
MSNCWVRVFEVQGYQVCAETGFEQGMPAIIFRMKKDTGLLRSKMCIQPMNKSREAFDLAIQQRDFTFEAMDSELVDAAVESMLELEPELMDGSVHAFVMEGDNKG